MLVPLYGKVTYNNRHSALQLGTKFGQHGKSARQAGWVTRGLTKTNLSRQMNIRIKYSRHANNRICAALVGVSLEIGYKQFHVYIARKLKPGTCEYRTTLNHENTHVRFYQTGLKNYVARLERKLRRTADRLTPIVATSPARAQRHFLSQLDQALASTLAQMNRDMDRNNSKIDTIANYKREQAYCPSR